MTLKKQKTWGILITLFALLLGGVNTQAQSKVFVNGAELSTEIVQQLEAYYRVKIQQGKYWYDPVCGLWGMDGGAAEGLLLAGLDFGAPLQANASKGKTGIYINGRQINSLERNRWKQLLGQTIPGRYMLDAWGNLSYENGAYIVNVVQVAQASQQSTFYRSSITDIGMGGDSSGFYIMGKDWSYSSF